jgi:S-adenosylmethionine-diacylgycerolhomoserine-N-methlytransferase
VVAVVDFHESRWAWFRRWMGVNHVRMEGQILQALLEGFTPRINRVKTAYAGIWSYLTFVGAAQDVR